MGTFDPTLWNFIKLRDFEYPVGISIYEYKNHKTIDGTPDFVRLNLYLSKDRSFVTIWHGLIDPFITEARLESVYKPSDFDFAGSYTENLFRGYIESQEEAKHIFKALRIDTGRQYALPQVLSGGVDNKLRCDLVKTA